MMHVAISKRPVRSLLSIFVVGVAGWLLLVLDRWVNGVCVTRF